MPLPGVRSLFFVAAGLAGMPRRAVYGYGALSALLWNLALLGVGAALGANYERLEHIVTTYTTIAGAEAAVAGIRHLDELRVYDLQGLHKSLN